jgi:hypothetical protein
MPKPKAVGQRGSWYAEVLGELLPCAHDYWLKRGHYIDPGVKPGEKKWDDYISAIREGGVIVLTHSQRDENGTFTRKGYNATFSVANVAVTENGLEFDLVNRLVDLQ